MTIYNTGGTSGTSNGILEKVIQDQEKIEEYFYRSIQEELKDVIEQYDNLLYEKKEIIKRTEDDLKYKKIFSEGEYMGIQPTQRILRKTIKSIEEQLNQRLAGPYANKDAYSNKN